MDKNESKKLNLTLKKSEREREIGERIFGKVPVKQSAKMKNDSIVKASDTQLESLQKEIADLKAENRRIKASAALDKSGCIKTDLVIKALPDDCEDIQAWIDNYKEENTFLFKEQSPIHGGSYKPTQSTNLSATEIMNNYIRGIM